MGGRAKLLIKFIFSGLTCYQGGPKEKLRASTLAHPVQSSLTIA
jgi:hypothetical protein